MRICGNSPHGKTSTARMSHFSWASVMRRSEPMMSLGSTPSAATKRSGCCSMARCDVSLPTPMSPFSMLCLSISPSVTATGSAPDSSSWGTSLNMYSTGKENSPFDSASFVCLTMNSYVFFMSVNGNPIMQSMIGTSVGIAMVGSSGYLRPYLS
jgi:hypothetical protein